MSRVLVTGATGLVGNNVVRHLLAQGEQVRALVREGSDVRPLEGLPVERAVGDVRDEAAVMRAVVGAEVVVHAAARVGVGTVALEEFRAVNVEGTRAVARAARAAGARMVHVSSVDALGRGTRALPGTENTPPTEDRAVPYVITKREAEEVVHAEIGRGLDAVTVNPVFTLGPWDWKPSSGRLLLAIARGGGVLAPPGGNDFCHAVDVAAGICAAAASGVRGERYVLGGEALTYRLAFALFAEITRGRAPRCTVPAPLVRAVGWAGTVLGHLTGSEPDLNAATAGFGCVPHHFDDGKARRELGYRSRPAREAASDAWEWLTKRGYAGESY